MEDVICLSPNTSLNEELESDVFDTPWTIKDFSIGKRLGKGRFGRVFLAKENKSQFQFLVAIKVIFKQMVVDTDTIKNFKRECDIHSDLDHRNIISFHGWFHDERKIYMILEYAPKGSLFKKLETEGPFDDKTASTMILQTANGLKYIHSKGVIHRDIKPENLLISLNGEIKIADFGWAKRIAENEQSKDELSGRPSFAGTIDYLSPEMLLATGHNHMVDIWCLGILCYELLIGNAPFYAKSKDQTIDNILKIRYNIPSSMNRMARNLITKLIVKNPEKRLQLNKVLTDEWIEKYAKKQ